MDVVAIHIIGYFLIFNFIGIAINLVHCQGKQTKFSHRLVGHTFHSIQGICFGKCQKECDVRAKCKSVNYFRKYKLCELNDDGRAGLSLTKTAGYVYFEREEWTEGQQNCDDDTESCSIKECVLPPKTSDGVLLGNKVSNGSRIIYGCSREYSVNYECNMGVWKPEIPLCYCSCKAVKETLSNLTSGLFHMCNPDVSVFCDFVSGGGYTYISQTSLRKLTTLSNHYTRSDHVMVRHRLESGIQKEGKLSVISKYADRYDVSVLLSNYKGFTPPLHINDKPYIYLGLVPSSVSVRGTTQGYQMNGVDVTFYNCDGNANNNLVVYADTSIIPLTVLKTTSRDSPYYAFEKKGLSDNTNTVETGHELPADHFYQKIEMRMGGCGTRMENTFPVAITGITFGLRFDV